jgi:AMP-polyphosphate phosphotransferase
MLENINLKKKISREDFKRVLPGLQLRLYDLEKACWHHGISTIIVIEGWDAAGKGSTIAALTQRLDPRGFRLYPITAPRTYERQQRPWLWRFWLKAPSRGEIVIFDHSWYRFVIDERVQGNAPAQMVQRACRDIVEFERMLAEDGTTILKFFFHISKKEQKRRFQLIQSDPLEAWRVTRDDWDRLKKYNKYLEATEEMLELTETDHAPWTVVEATSKWHARKKVFETVIAAMEARLGGDAPPRHKIPSSKSKDAELRAVVESLEGEKR